MKRKDYGMIQKESLQFFGAFRRFGRANKNMNKQSVVVCGVDMEELQDESWSDDGALERPGFAELLVYMMLVSHRHATTNVCWLSKRGCADKLCLSPSTVHAAYKWLEKAKLIYLHDDNRLVRRMVKNGKGHQVNLYTIFDLPGYRWASTVRVTTSKHLAAKFEREPQDSNEGFYETLNDVFVEAEDAGLLEQGREPFETMTEEGEDPESKETLYPIPDHVVKEQFESEKNERTLLDAFVAREVAEKKKFLEEQQQLENVGQLRLLGGNDGK